MKNNINLIICCMVLAILATNLAFAFGVGSPYWKGNPLIIAPGETKIATLTIQNMEGKDLIVRAEVSKGKEIASITEKEFLIKAGTINTEVPVKVTITSDTALDETYEVTVSFNSVVAEQTGGIAFGTGMDTTFDVLVAPKTAKKSQGTSVIWILIGAVALIAVVIVVLVIKRRK